MKIWVTFFILVLPFIVDGQFNPPDNYSAFDLQPLQRSMTENVNFLNFQQPLPVYANSIESDSLNVSFLGSWGFGWSTSISCNGAGNIIFVGSGAGVIELNVSNPYDPVFLGEVRTQGIGEVYGIYFDSIANNLYLTTYPSGFEIWNLSNPSNPILLGRASTNGVSFGGIFFSDKYVYITASSGVEVFDVSDPSSPVKIGNCDLSYYAGNSAKNGDNIFVALWNEGGMEVVDVSNPFNPHIVGSSDYTATGIWVVNGYAYIVDYHFGLRILDINNLSNIFLVGSLSMDDGQGRIIVIGDYAYIANGSSSGGGIYVVDISIPTIPHLESTFEAFGQFITGKGQMVAFTCSSLCNILDITNPINPILAYNYPIPGLTWDVAVSGNYAYLGSNGFRVFDITDKTYPIEVGYNSNDGGGIKLKGDKALYINYNYNENSRLLMIMDISNSTTPSLLGQCILTLNAGDMAIKDHYAFVGCWWEGFLVVDFQDPANPALVAQRFGWYQGAVPGEEYCFVQSLDVEDNYLYLIDYGPFEDQDTRGLYIFDISAPVNPVKISRYNGLLSDGKELDVVGNFAYIIDNNGGMEVIDITNKQYPQAHGYISLPDAPKSIAVQENHAFIADYNGLQVVNVANPDSPYIDGYYTTSGVDAWGVSVNGNNIYLATRWTGFRIFQTDFNTFTPEITTVNGNVFMFFPNPTKGTFVIELKEDIPDDNVQVDVYGMWGENLLTEVLNRERRHEFSITNWPSGIYFIRVIADNYVETSRIIKQ